MSKEINSDISGFYDLSIKERWKELSEQLNLSEKELDLLKNFGYMSFEEMDSLIENVIGSFQLPLGIACNFKINNKDYLIPMCTEEPSVIAAASKAAKIARAQGGFRTSNIKPLMIGQVQILDVEDNISAIEAILDNKSTILDLANAQDPALIEIGGGAIDVEIREIATIEERILVLHLLVDVKDAMGANTVNTMVEAISPYLEEITKGKVNIRIISNLSQNRIIRAQAIFDKELLGGEEIIKRIIKAYHFACADPFRATTHNKGIMNGITAVTLATGNDTRAVEAGAHAYASLKGIYSPLTEYFTNKHGHLVGQIELPLALGIVGGMTKAHPMAQLVLKILDIDTANELCQVVASVGLAQNLAALRALVDEGIQEGHMKLHARKQEK